MKKAKKKGIEAQSGEPLSPTLFQATNALIGDEENRREQKERNRERVPNPFPQGENTYIILLLMFSCLSVSILMFYFVYLHNFNFGKFIYLFYYGLTSICDRMVNNLIISYRGPCVTLGNVVFMFLLEILT